MSLIYGGEFGHAAIRTDGTRACFTPDGPKFFSSNEQLLDYIRERCGKDVADCIDLDCDILSMFTELVENVDLLRPAEIMDEFDLNKDEFTESELKSLREAFSIYEAIRSGVYQIADYLE